jgi:thymidine phosphorylase
MSSGPSFAEYSDYLAAIDMGIDTHQEPVAYMRSDCHVCRAEGFEASSRIALEANGKQLIATLNVVDPDQLEAGGIGLSKIAVKKLGVSPGDLIQVGHAPVLDSLSFVRRKVHGLTLSEPEITAIICDINDHLYSDLEIGSFLSASAGGRLNIDEIISLTRAMVACGKHLNWGNQQNIYDKHCIGGLPGNRTTPLVVAIVSAAGLIIPKTSSRAITSPAGTADTVEVLTRVNLSLDQMQQVVHETGACLAWGGAVNLSPADDIMIRIERALDLDGEGQLIASVLSKKIAAGSTHVVIDIPVGLTAKVRSMAEADHLSGLFTRVGEACGIYVRCVLTDGSCPVGWGIGPAEEARDILSVLQGLPEAPIDLRNRALLLAAHLLDMANQRGLDEGLHQATALLDNGEAWKQFQKIIEAQGGMKEIPVAPYTDVCVAEQEGKILSVDNRKLARLAKLAGAPADISAGLRLHANKGQQIKKGEALFTLYSESMGERDYALAYYQQHPDIFLIGEKR